MEILKNISPIDGRYNNKTVLLKEYFSEYAFMKYRVKMEIEYLVFLIKTLELPFENDITNILNIYNNFTLEDCTEIKNIEYTTNHDVKAVEYFIRHKLEKLNMKQLNMYIHFGLTSQDINNCAITLSIKDYIENIYVKHLTSIIDFLNELHKKWNNIVIIAKTHGQYAVPTTLGKEIKVFSYRLQKQLDLLKDYKYYGKFGGAVGNLNSHYFAYNEVSWDFELDNFLNKLGLIRETYTTQIDNYENLSTLFDNIRRINTILIDLAKDIWGYISFNYFNQNFKKGEVGSSTMPQKINPINFENSEGNLLLANSQLDFMSNKLPVSRFQRDLTDSTILRNIGVIFGHIYISYENLLIGLKKVSPNLEVIKTDLENNYSVLSEALQIILRKHNIENGYEIIKELFRNNNKISKSDFKDIISKLPLEDSIKEKLYLLNHENYIGNCLLKNK